MLSARQRLPSVCFSCRLNLARSNLASHVRSVRPAAAPRRSDSQSRQLSADARSWTAQRRPFSTAGMRRQDVEGSTSTSAGKSAGASSPAKPPHSNAETTSETPDETPFDEVFNEAEAEAEPDASEVNDVATADAIRAKFTPEQIARRARHLFGDKLPKDHNLTEEEMKVYERLYGEPVFVDSVEEIFGEEAEEVEMYEEELEDGTHVLLRKMKDGTFEEVEIFDEAEGLEEEGEFEGKEVEEGDEHMGEVVNTSSMTAEQWKEYRERKAEVYHRDVYERSMNAREAALEAEQDQYAEEDGDEGFMRAHPLTLAARSRTSPSTVYLPKETFVDPIAQLLTRTNAKHLQESANRIFGGPGLPNSASVSPASANKAQVPIPLDTARSDMGNIESDAYLAAVMPGTYAAAMSVLVEVRKRLGSGWIEHLLNKKGGPLILDAGSGGAGVLAWHEVLKAEWSRMHEESGATSHGDAPLGKSTILTGSDTLRHRASRLLENTTFIPRLPEMETTAGLVEDGPKEDGNEKQPRKLYDLIIAPHTLWPLKQEFMRKELVEKYWSLLNPKGGVLIVMEKGLPRGFEVVAAAREYLLDRYIASPGSTEIEIPLDEQINASKNASSKPGAGGKADQKTDENDSGRWKTKETGMIIAPCTNHAPCPMYKSPGVSLGRKDFCFFSQRYIRPPFLQRILNATDRNHEDVQFSYVAVQRGRDQRLPLHDILGKGVVQGDSATDAAFEGHEWKAAEREPKPEGEATYQTAGEAKAEVEAAQAAAEEDAELVTPQDVNTLELPRLLLPPLKRRGHIVLDVCTPSGTLERWTVPRSFSKQAFRDARKAQWGDLWALGAKTRIPKNVRLGRARDEFDRKGRRIRAEKKPQVINIDIGDKGFEKFSEAGSKARRGGGGGGDRDGRYTLDRKIRGSGGRKGRKGGKSAGGLLDELD